MTRDPTGLPGAWAPIATRDPWGIAHQAFLDSCEIDRPSVVRVFLFRWQQGFSGLLQFHSWGKDKWLFPIESGSVLRGWVDVGSLVAERM